MKTVSIQIPAYNEKDVLNLLYERLTTIIDSIGYYQLGGIQLLSIGITGEYLGRLFNEKNNNDTKLVVSNYVSK
ncbi:hypothetical protein FHS15_003498 [Paenibacillus castaneae]|uniref:hypothetical protein n=1 Tax=Paenibacillus castaneae TaxID=474957 RepID=UPI000C9B2F15|nr:hypothetical protein [Paenibacillus castaneae]NIK78360.1 hypothetical protein [Paenibacillus castaneae]